MIGEEVWFEPRHPFRQGTRYSLLSTVGSAAPTELGSLVLPPVDQGAVSSVLEIYPTSPEIPLNNLKLYICFSGPMSEGWSGRALQALDEETREALEGVFLPMEPELWDPARRRLTVLLDPGRIKRGLRAHLELGYPLRRGRRVAVVVGRGFRDAAGRPLLAPAVRRYRVGPAVRRRVDPQRWRWRWPAAPRAPLEVAFDRPLDHALLQRCISVLDADGAALPGDLGVPAGERGVSFRPRTPWQRGARYRVTVDPHLEDLAGNSLRRVFDRDLSRPGNAPGRPEDFSLDFLCAW
ncbi:MAG TPA: Ig-like domain-containing protein [Candidatus Dormibacteraeota bacterium]|nr:Ig-like domain-containing protein [Candidatus Dormibacteraeota bacterium]